MGKRSSLFGIFIVRSIKFNCTLDHAKRSFYRAVNGIFAKLGRLASAEVILYVMSKMYVNSTILFRRLKSHCLKANFCLWTLQLIM